MVWVLGTSVHGKKEGTAGGLQVGLLQVVAEGCHGGQLHLRGKSVVSTTSGKHLFPWGAGVELVRSLESKELKGFQRGEDNCPRYKEKTEFFLLY